MKTIRHQWLTNHNHSIVVLPQGQVPAESEFGLVQRDAAVIRVAKVPSCLWTFAMAELPEMFTLMFFGITKAQMIALLQRNYPQLAALPADQQIIHFIGVKKL